MAELFDIVGFTKEVERRAGTHGLRVNFSKTITVPHISGNTINLPRMPAPITMDTYRFIRCAYIHELAHWHNKRAMALRKEYPIDIQSNLGGVWNILEDELDERLASEAYPGDGKALGEGHIVILRQTLEVIKKRTADMPDLKPDDVKKIGCWLMANHTRDWDPFSPPLVLAMRRSFPASVTDLCDDLINEGWAEKIARMRDADDVIDLAKALHKRLWPEEPDAQQQLDDAKEGKDKPEKGEGEGEADSEGSPTEGDAKSDDKEEKSVIKWEDLVMADHADNERKNPSKMSFIDWTGKQNRGIKFVPAKSNQIKVIKIHHG